MAATAASASQRQSGIFFVPDSLFLVLKVRGVNPESEAKTGHSSPVRDPRRPNYAGSWSNAPAGFGSFQVRQTGGKNPRL
jgi:hypothetical protein